MKFIYYILFFTFTASLTKASISFNTDTVQKSVPANECIELTITAEWPQGSNTYIVYKPTMPQLTGMTIVDHVTFGRTLTVNSQVVQRMVHLFTFSVTNSPGEEAETGPILIDYRTPATPEKHHKKLSGIIYTVISPENTTLKIILILTVSMLIISALISFFAVWISRKKTTHKHVQNAIEDSLLIKLDEIKRLRIDGNNKRYFHELELMIKDYFRIKYQVGSILDCPSCKAGKKGPDEHTLTTARELLKLSHNVSYAGYPPTSHDKDRIFEFIRKLLLHNRPHKSIPEEELYLKQ